jgi:quercetin 2,3-dioxygenase
MNRRGFLLGVCLYSTTMITIRKSSERGYADHGWLKSFHSFSFANYHDPRHMGFGNLRVINEDRIAAGTGFGTHPHRDMEIISYALSGSLSHKDSMGNNAVIVPGEVQRMSAGTGIAHSEHNHAQGTTHFLQIWIEPNAKGLKPSYEQKAFNDADKRGKLLLVGSPDGANASVQFNADAKLYAGLFDGDQQTTLTLETSRKYYVFLIKGQLSANGQTMSAGDAMLMASETSLSLAQGKDAEVLVFDLQA